MNARKAQQKNVEDRLEGFDTQITELKAKASKANAATQALYSEQLEALGQQRETVVQQLEAFKGASEEAFGEIKQGLDQAVDNLQLAFSKASSHFK